MLGHISMVLDVKLSDNGRFLLSADRDEKLRVSRYPQSFVIHCFCLGHSSFIKSIISTYNIAFSAGEFLLFCCLCWFIFESISIIELFIFDLPFPFSLHFLDVFSFFFFWNFFIKEVVISGGDNTIRAWNIDTGENIATALLSVNKNVKFIRHWSFDVCWSFVFFLYILILLIFTGYLL